MKETYSVSRTRKCEHHSCKPRGKKILASLGASELPSDAPLLQRDDVKS